MATFRADRFKATCTSISGGGSFQIHGLAPGQYMVAEKAVPLNALEVGEDGEAAWLQSRNGSGKVTFTLMQASLANADISAQVALDELDGTGLCTLQALDLTSGTFVEGTGRWEQQAPVGYGGQFVPRVWAFIAESLSIKHGGITQR